ncbi:unnamed protein product [Protopolystoma xenopodis]|uniref:Uncharacterized protein n=1 Tax=Protopolystoma xenopodis TaxID=117903 RepID=A0A3S5AY15_9PLAT|nr:unnamed protein product [Protopolystoma xenopodis]
MTSFSNWPCLQSLPATEPPLVLVIEVFCLPTFTQPLGQHTGQSGCSGNCSLSPVSGSLRAAQLGVRHKSIAARQISMSCQITCGSFLIFSDFARKPSSDREIGGLSKVDPPICMNRSGPTSKKGWEIAFISARHFHAIFHPPALLIHSLFPTLHLYCL